MSASFAFDAGNGGRLSSLMVNGLELIYNNSAEPATSWGGYPMIPYAGRVDHGRFSHNGNVYQLEINQNEHAMHGIGFTSAWEQIGDSHLVLDFDERWPLGGTAAHRGTLTEDDGAGQLELELSIIAGASSMPAMLGWHPWFNRTLSADGPSAQLRMTNFDSVEMYDVAANMIPTGTTTSPPSPGPWDHPFRAIDQPIELKWESQLLVHLYSTCDHWVVYDRPDHALCVEPQSGPPDIFNSERFDVDPTILQPGEELRHTFTIEWQTL